MPTYDYLCSKCGYELEKFQPITAKSLRKCPKCLKNGLERVISGGAGFIFKGSGFYETDYNRSQDYKDKSKKESESTVSKSNKATTDKKPEAIPEAKPKKTQKSLKKESQK